MIFPRLFCIFGTVQSVLSPEIHDLRYIYTALSKPISQPGIYQFTAMGILDDRQIDFYNSTDKVKMQMQKWMEKDTPSRRRMEQWFVFSIKILMEHMHQNKPDPDVHILQWMHGCQVEKTTDGMLKFLKGFDQYGYDGDDFLSFDIQRMEWVVHAKAAESIKKKWDDEPILSQYTKEYLETDCVHFLEKLVKLQTFSPPEVHIFSKKSTNPDYRTLVCLATGFFPKDVSVNILKDGVPLAESDGVLSSGVRPNGERKETFQLRKWLEIKASDTSQYSCRIHHRTLKIPIEESWDGTCHNCDGDNTGAIVGGVVGVVLLIVLVAVLVVLYVLHKEKKAAQAPVNGLDQPLTGVKLETKRSKDYVESGDPGKGSATSDGSKEEVNEPLMADAARAHVNGLNQPLCPLAVNGGKMETKGSTDSLGSDDSFHFLFRKGSATSDGSKEEVNEPLMADGVKV